MKTAAAVIATTVLLGAAVIGFSAPASAATGTEPAPAPAKAAATSSDLDRDGLSNSTEKRTRTNPRDADSDDDRLTDGYELRTSKTNPRSADTDKDALTDHAEVKTHKTNPRVADTDRDGLADSAEVTKHRTNPLVPDARTLLGAPGSYRPTAATTGVPQGVALTKIAGDVVLSTPGQVLEGVDVSGFVKVTAPDVTIKNSIIRGRTPDRQTALVTVQGPEASLTIVDSELFSTARSGWVDGIRGYRFTATRVNIHDVIDPVHVYGDDVTVEASWLHDNVHLDADPLFGGEPSHDDTIQIQKGSNIRIVGNDTSGSHNTGIQLTQDRGPVSDVTIDRNWLDGGGCTVNLAESGKGAFQGITVTNNTFGRTTKVANCAIISPRTTVVDNSGNVFTDGTAATVRRG